MRSILSRLPVAFLALALFVAITSPLAAQRLNPNFARVGLGLPIPPSGTGGGASSPTNTFSVDLDVATVGTVAAPIVYLNLSHTFVADLVISLSHNGTTVLLSDGNGFTNFNADYAGQYDFRDDAATSIDAAPAAAGVITPGAYRPDQPLSAFAGMNAAGRWTLTIYDRAIVDVGILDTFGLVIELNTVFADAPSLPQAIPPSGSGGGTCGAPTNTFSRDFVMPAAGRVGAIGLDLDISHSFTADLVISLSHNGVTRFVSNRQGGSNVLTGFYIFREGFAPLGTTTPGFYGFRDALNPFYGMSMGGVWTLTICDAEAFDVGTLRSARLLIAPQGYNLQVLQPNGSADISTSLTNGERAFNNYFSPFSGAPGNFPLGWFYGIDVSFFDLVTLFNSGLPTIVGSLDSNAANFSTLPIAIPSGIPLWLTSIELRGPTIIQQATPINYVTL